MIYLFVSPKDNISTNNCTRHYLFLVFHLINTPFFYRLFSDNFWFHWAWLIQTDQSIHKIVYPHFYNKSNDCPRLMNCLNWLFLFPICVFYLVNYHGCKYLWNISFQVVWPSVTGNHNGHGMITPYPYMSPPFFGTWENPVGAGAKKKRKGEGPLLGKNSPFNSIPVLGTIL